MVEQADLTKKMIEIFEQVYITDTLRYDLEKVSQIKSRTVQYWILDATLSKKFQVNIDQAINRWNEEMEEIEKIHLNIVNNPLFKNVSKPYKCIRFALDVLRHLLYKGKDTDVRLCSYQSGARNFIITLTKTNRALCKSYTDYVQSCAETFGYTDYLKRCSMYNHVFSIVSEDDSVRIGIDAGSDRTENIIVNLYTHKDLSFEELSKLLDFQNHVDVINETEDVECFQEIYHESDDVSEFVNIMKETHLDGIRSYKDQMTRFWIIKEIYKNVKPYFWIIRQLFQDVRPLHTFVSTIMERNMFQHQLATHFLDKFERELIPVYEKKIKALNEKIAKFPIRVQKIPNIDVDYIIYQLMQTLFPEWNFIDAKPLSMKCYYLDHVITYIKEKMPFDVLTNILIDTHYNEYGLVLKGNKKNSEQVVALGFKKIDIDAKFIEFYITENAIIYYNPTNLTPSFRDDMEYRTQENMPEDQILIVFDTSEQILEITELNQLFLKNNHKKSKRKKSKKGRSRAKTMPHLTKNQYRTRSKK